MGTPAWETREGPHSFADEMRIKKHQSFTNWIIGKDLKRKKVLSLEKKATEKVKGTQKTKHVTIKGRDQALGLNTDVHLIYKTRQDKY